MIITLEARADLKAIVKEAVAEVMGVKPQPVVETPPAITFTPDRMTVQQVLELAQEYRRVLKKHDKTMNQHRNHPFDSKVANRAIEAARDELEAMEERYQSFCKGVAAGWVLIGR